MFVSPPHIEIPFTGKEKVFKTYNLELFLHMLKFKIIKMRIGEDIRL